MNLTPGVVVSFYDELEKIAAKPREGTFAGKKELSITPEERAAFNARLQEAGVPGGCGLTKTEAGFSAHTHRARTSWYEHPSKFPLAKLRFIESTG